jgi:hypothetical protein
MLYSFAAFQSAFGYRLIASMLFALSPGDLPTVTSVSLLLPW